MIVCYSDEAWYPWNSFQSVVVLTVEYDAFQQWSKSNLYTQIPLVTKWSSIRTIGQAKAVEWVLFASIDLLHKQGATVSIASTAQGSSKFVTGVYDQHFADLNERYPTVRKLFYPDRNTRLKWHTRSHQFASMPLVEVTPQVSYESPWVWLCDMLAWVAREACKMNHGATVRHAWKRYLVEQCMQMEFFKTKK